MIVLLVNIVKDLGIVVKGKLIWLIEIIWLSREDIMFFILYD